VPLFTDEIPVCHGDGKSALRFGRGRANAELWRHCVSPLSPPVVTSEQSSHAATSRQFVPSTTLRGTILRHGAAFGGEEGTRARRSEPPQNKCLLLVTTGGQVPSRRGRSADGLTATVLNVEILTRPGAAPLGFETNFRGV
jgi:hypothetical protein